MRRILFASLGILLLSSLVHAADALPKQADIQADFDAGKYQDCLKKIALVININSKDYDRYTLLILKGEALLQQKVGPAAADAFGFAAKATKDKKEYAVAMATEMLIKKSVGLEYTPKGSKTPLPIVDKASRPAAIEALFKDELAADQAIEKALLRSTALPPIVEFARTLGQLSLLEYAATGNENEAPGMKKELAAHAKSAIDKALDANKATVERIRNNANQTDVRERQVAVDPNTKRQTWVRETIRRGLSNDDISTLGNIYGVSAKLPAVCVELANALGADFRGTVTDAEGVARSANDVSRLRSEVTRTETFYR